MSEQAKNKPVTPTVTITALEYEALKNVDKMVRMAMTIPATGEFLVAAIQAMDAVRFDLGLDVPEIIKPLVDKPLIVTGASDLAQSLIRRSQYGEKS